MGNPSLENEVRVYRKSDIIFEENAPGNEMYIVRSGKVKLVFGWQEQEIEVSTLEAGEYFGEMALIDTSLRSATAIALEDNTGLEVLNREGFIHMIRNYPEFALDMMQELTRRVRRGNILYSQVIREAMAPFCPRNCLRKTMDSFIRASILHAEKELEVAAGIARWKCGACDYVYDPRFGDPSSSIQPGVPFEELPDNWVCPVCGASKSTFQTTVS